MLEKSKKSTKRKELEQILESCQSQVESLQALIEKTTKEGRVNWSYQRELDIVKARVREIKSKLK